MMSGFIENYGVDGRPAIAIAEIERIGPPRPRQEPYCAVRTATLRSGAAYELNDFEVDQLMRRAVQLLPAAPDTWLLSVDIHREEGDAYGETFRAPVIAWALCVDGEIRAVTPNGVNDGRGDHVEGSGGHHVLMPDGTVQGVGEHAEPCCAADVEELERILRKEKV